MNIFLFELSSFSLIHLEKNHATALMPFVLCNTISENVMATSKQVVVVSVGPRKNHNFLIKVIIILLFYYYYYFIILLLFYYNYYYII